jgi:serine protease Do/serine protease DegQ
MTFSGNPFVPRVWLSILILVLFGSASPAGAASLTTRNGLPSLAPLVQQVTPAVVNISVISRVPVQQNPLFQDPFFRRFFNLPEQPQTRQEQAVGSGVIVDAQHGYVLTNNHVIKNAERITVTLKDRRQFRAKLIGTDPETDIAVLKIDADRLTALPFGDSDQLKVGDYVVAIGNPFGLGQTVTAGIVSALGRSGLHIEGYEDFIQTDASINPGNSGGALVDLEGKLIGINTAIVGPSGGNVGIGFAIPSNMAHAVMEQIIRHGKVQRGVLGIEMQDLTPELAEALGISAASGAVITSVVTDSPAAKAGLRTRDVVVAMNGRAIESSSDLRNRLGLTPIGQDVKLTVVRNHARETVTARIAAPPRPQQASGKKVPQLPGLEVANLKPGNPLYGHVKGALAVAVGHNSRAWFYGLRPGDVIYAVNQNRVESVAALIAALRHAGHHFSLQLVRGNFQVSISIG